MLVSEFIKIWDETKVETAKKKLVSDHIIRKYVPVSEKRARLQLCLNSSIVKDENDLEYIDMMINKINIFYAVIKFYTDISADKDKEDKSDIIGMYDEFCQRGIDKIFIDSVGNDINELIFVNEQLLDTWHLKNSSTKGYVNDLIFKITSVINGLSGDLKESMQDIDFNELIKNATPETIEKIKGLIK